MKQHFVNGVMHGSVLVPMSEHHVFKKQDESDRRIPETISYERASMVAKGIYGYVFVLSSMSYEEKQAYVDEYVYELEEKEIRNE